MLLQTVEKLQVTQPKKVEHRTGVNICVGESHDFIGLFKFADQFGLLLFVQHVP